MNCAIIPEAKQPAAVAPTLLIPAIMAEQPVQTVP